MKTIEREHRYIAKHLPLAKAGDSSAMHNVGAAYRILGKHAAAYRWWKKSAASGDGSDNLEVGYCLHHGAGVRKDLAAAARAYEIAMVSGRASQLDREEAMYLRAVLLLSSSVRAARKRAASLLRKANADNDYPQAAQLLTALDSSPKLICTCRRELRFGLARLHCRVHRLIKKQSRTSRSSRTRPKRRAS
jgi:TPR repeat protein